MTVCEKSPWRSRSVGRTAEGDGRRDVLHEFFVVVKEEQFVFLDGAAEIGAEVVEAVARTLGPEVVVRPRVGVQRLIAHVVENRGVKVVGAGLGDDVDHRAAARAVFRLEIVGQHRNFLDRFEAGSYRCLGVAALVDDTAAVQVHLRLAAGLAVDLEIGIAGGRVFAAVERVRISGGSAGYHLQQVDPVAAGERHFRYLLGLHGGEAHCRVFHQRLLRGSRYGHGLRGCAHVQRDLAEGHLLESIHVQVLDLLFFETRMADCYRVHPHHYGGERKQAGFVGGGHARDLRSALG